MTILKKILSHALIVLGGMFLVFSIINFLNDAMNFLNNEISLVLLLIWAVLSMVTGGVFVADMLKKEADTAKKAKPRSTREHRAARRSSCDEYDFDTELDSLINVETRHEKRSEKNSDELDLFSASDRSEQKSPVKPSPEKLTGAARYKKNKM